MDEVWKLVLNGGVSVVLAYIVLKWQRADLISRAADCKECADRNAGMASNERADKLMMLEVIQRNTEAVTKLIVAVDNQGVERQRRDHHEASKVTV